MSKEITILERPQENRIKLGNAIITQQCTKECWRSTVTQTLSCKSRAGLPEVWSMGPNSTRHKVQYGPPKWSIQKHLNI